MTLLSWATKFGAFTTIAAACTTVGCSSAREPWAPAAVDECLGTSSQSVVVTCAGPTTLRGIDISSYQGDVDWAAVKKTSTSFVFLRVSDGVTHPDMKFNRNWTMTRELGLRRGVYQFFRPTRDVDEQVDLMIDMIAMGGGLLPGDLPPVLDLETDGGLPAATVVERSKAWLARVEAKYGVKPIVYTSANMSKVIGTHFAGYTLWVANYGVECPKVPDGWTKWHFWQDTDKGSLAGVAGNVDMNYFNGTASELQAFGATTAVDVDGIVRMREIHNTQNDIYQGSTMGSESPKVPDAAPLDPCQ